MYQKRRHRNRFAIFHRQNEIKTPIYIAALSYPHHKDSTGGITIMSMVSNNENEAQGQKEPPEESQYILSGNISETTRLRLQHDVIKDAMGGQLVLAPADLSRSGLRILDSATADGTSTFRVGFDLHRSLCSQLD